MYWKQVSLVTIFCFFWTSEPSAFGLFEAPAALKTHIGLKNQRAVCQTAFITNKWC